VATLDTDSPFVTNATQASGPCYTSAARSAAITRYPILPGEVLLLRWSDPDDAGGDHGFGIDDLTVGWAAGALQEAVPVGRAGAAENFDEMGRDAPATLVWPWRTEARGGSPRTNGPYATAGTRALLANTSAGFTQAGTYVFTGQALGDQAVGGLPCGADAATVTVYGKFRNTAGMPIRRWRVGYVVEKYRNGTASTAVRLGVSADGETWRAGRVWGGWRHGGGGGGGGSAGDEPGGLRSGIGRGDPGGWPLLSGLAGRRRGRGERARGAGAGNRRGSDRADVSTRNGAVGEVIGWRKAEEKS
jgi:hypothetical protein